MNWKTFIVIALSLIIVEATFAKEKKVKKITISGYVVDGNEVPLSGISIIVDGVTLNKETNNKGFYKIKVKPTIKTLMMFSLLNGGLEVEFTGRTKINFILAPATSNSSVNTVTSEIVDIGYGKVKKENLTYSSANIKNEDSKSPKYNSIFDMIQGRVPGVSVSGSSIIIRGIGTVMGNPQPLFVVDGITTSSIDHINPSDVKSIDVLKGAATAIYGTRGANGVILITTKRGSDRK